MHFMLDATSDGQTLNWALGTAYTVGPFRIEVEGFLHNANT